MEQIAVDWSVVPMIDYALRLYALVTTLDFWLRAYAFTVGLLMAGHFKAMINADHGHSPLLLKAIVLACLGCGLYIAADAFFTTQGWSVRPALCVTPLLAFVMFLWTHGLHVCDWVEAKWGAKHGSAG
jgi:hypothetical protein